MKYVFLFSFLIFQSALAKNEILLVAHKTTPFKEYKQICVKNEYLCFPNAYKVTQQPKTVHFDRLIENFDTDNKSYVAQFSKDVSLSLKEDDLSLAQIKSLIFAAEKVKQLNTTAELKKIYMILDKMQEEESDRVIFVAGKMLANNFKNKSILEPILDKLKYVEIDYISILNTDGKKYFLNGDCDHPRYAEMISQLDHKVIPHFAEGCNLSERYNWGSDLMKNHFLENKNKYALAGAAILTMFFLKSYDVSIGN